MLKSKHWIMLVKIAVWGSISLYFIINIMTNYIHRIDYYNMDANEVVQYESDKQGSFIQSTMFLEETNSIEVDNTYLFSFSVTNLQEIEITTANPVRVFTKTITGKAKILFENQTDDTVLGVELNEKEKEIHLSENVYKLYLVTENYTGKIKLNIVE